MSKPYLKIDTLFDRDEKFRVMEGFYRRPEFGVITLWQASEKIDGTSVRIDYRLVDDALSVTYGGRTDKTRFHPEAEQALKDIVEDQSASELVRGKLAEYDVNSITLYGELVGPKVQGNVYRLERHEVVLFDVLVNDRTWLHQDDVGDYGNDLYLRTPYVYYLSTDEVVDFLTRPSCCEPVSALSPDGERVPIEGFVLRPQEELRDQRGRRLIAKLKRKDFA